MVKMQKTYSSACNQTLLLGVGTTMSESCLVIAIKSKCGTISHLQTHVLGVFPKKS